MKFRWKLLILMLVISIIPVVSLRTLGIQTVRLMAGALISQVKEKQIDDARHRLQLVMDDYSKVIRTSREQAEMALFYQTFEVRRILQTELYCAGWIKRGPTGIIGTNRADSVATVNSLLADLPALEPGTEKIGADALLPLLAERGVRTISFSDWLKIDAAEVSRGKAKDKPREKFTRYAEILQLLGS